MSTRSSTHLLNLMARAPKGLIPERDESMPPSSTSNRQLKAAASVTQMARMIVLWFAKVGHGQYQPPSRPWYPHKAHASFADMLTTLKQVSVREQVLQTGLAGRGSRKILKTLDTALHAAA